jgi:hypothetical protein
MDGQMVYYYDSYSMLIINKHSEIKRLYTPFSVLSIESIRKRLSPSTLDQIDSWLGTKYASMAKRFANAKEPWVYLISSSAEFRSVTSSARRVFHDIVTKHPELFFVSPSSAPTLTPS